MNLIKKIAIFWVAVVSIATMSVQSVKAQAKQSYIFLQGVENMMLGNVQIAESLLGTLLEMNPTHAPANFYLGKIEAGRNNLSKAEEYLGKAYSLDTTNSSYTQLYINVLMANSSYARGYEMLEKQMVNKPNDKRNYIAAITILTDMDSISRGAKISETYAENFGYDEQIVEATYNMYIRAKEYYSALGYMHRVCAAQPDNLYFLLSLADLTAALGNKVEAERLYKDALAKDSNSLQAQLSIANFYKYSDRMTEYIASLKAPFENLDMRISAKISIFEDSFFEPEIYRFNYNSIQALMNSLVITHPRDNRVRMLYGRYLGYMGMVDEALTQYEMMYGEKVKDSTLYERLTEIYIYKKQFDDAVAVSRQGQSDFGGFTFTNGEIVSQWLGGNSKGAIKLIDKAVKTFESDSLRSVLYGMKGDIYQQDGKMSQCFSAYKKGLKYDENNALILNNYGYYLGERGQKLDLALEMTTRANELSPDNPTYLDSQAWVLFMMGRYVDAQLLMSRVMELDKTPSGDVLMHYGDILYALGDDYLARNYWKKSLEAGGDAKDIEERVLRPKAVRE